MYGGKRYSDDVVGVGSTEDRRRNTTQATLLRTRGRLTRRKNPPPAARPRCQLYPSFQRTAGEMMSLQEFQAIHHSCFPRASPQLGLFRNVQNRRRASYLVRSEQVPVALTSSSSDQPQRRQLLALGAIVCPLLISMQTKTSFAAETKKGFLAVTDKKDGYSFLYPFGWQEVVVEGQDKVFKDVIEPLESVSINVFPTTKQDIRDFGSAQEVAETLIKKVLASPSQKIKLIEAKERDEEGKAYYTFEFIAQAPNFTRHALGSVCIGNGKFYTLTTGANERRWEKMKERLHTVVDSFQIFTV